MTRLSFVFSTFLVWSSFWSAAFICAPNAARAGGAIVSVSQAVGWESDSDGLGYRTSAPWSARAGWAFANVDLLVEYGSRSRVDGEAGGPAGGEIVYTERQAAFWVRKVFSTSFFAKPYVGAAIGARFERTRERFMGETEETEGQPRWLSAVGGGAFAPIAWGLVAELEARLTASPGYAPNPQMSASAGLGWRF